MPRFIGSATAPGDIEFTITATMKLSEWRAIAQQLYDDGRVVGGPGGWLHSAIVDISRKANASYEPEPEGTDE